MHTEYMNKLNPYSYKSYRKFLDDLLEAEGMTYRKFCEKFTFISFGNLSNILGKSKSGQYRCRRDLSVESFALLLSKQNYSKDEILYLCLLHSENTSQTLPVHGGSFYKSLVRKALGKLSKQKILDHSKQIKLGDMSSSLINQMPRKYQKRIADYILKYYEDSIDQEINFNLDFHIDDYIKKIDELQ